VVFLVGTAQDELGNGRLGVEEVGKLLFAGHGSGEESEAEGGVAEDPERGVMPRKLERERSQEGESFKDVVEETVDVVCRRGVLAPV